MNFIKTIVNFILNIIFPPKCVFCGELLEPYSKEKAIDGHVEYCEICAEELHFCSDFKCCLRCGKPSVRINQHGFCFNCTSKEYNLLDYRIISVLFYEGKVKNSILRYKLNGKRNYSKSYSYLLHNKVDKEFSDVEFDFITSAPPTKDSQRRKRGFDHAELLARRLSKKMNVKYRSSLKKLKSAKHQRGLGFSERVGNLSNRIVLLKNCNVKNKTILLVDDVCTTGSTVRECANVLYKNGAEKVYAVTLATVVKEKVNSLGILSDVDLYNMFPQDDERLSLSIID